MESPATRLMRNPVFSRIYQKAWRPIFTRGFSLGGHATADYDKALRAYLCRPGERMVLDIACGPGNYTRHIADGLTGDGQVVGVDYSAPMLATAVATNSAGRASYLRVDAHAIPFSDNSFDEVICLAALYLIPDPLPVLDEMMRVALPGGLLVVFTSVAGPISTLPGVRTLAGIGGYRVFDRDEITGRLRDLGAEHIEQTFIDEGQYVLCRKPSGA
ncbi:class I SAM-dependent methyltransferase [Gordonia sp. NPDC003504]